MTQFLVACAPGPSPPSIEVGEARRCDERKECVARDETTAALVSTSAERSTGLRAPSAPGYRRTSVSPACSAKHFRTLGGDRRCEVGQSVRYGFGNTPSRNSSSAFGHAASLPTPRSPSLAPRPSRGASAPHRTLGSGPLRAAAESLALEQLRRRPPVNQVGAPTPAADASGRGTVSRTADASRASDAHAWHAPAKSRGPPLAIGPADARACCPEPPPSSGPAHHPEGGAGARAPRPAASAVGRTRRPPGRGRLGARGRVRRNRRAPRLRRGQLARACPGARPLRAVLHPRPGRTGHRGGARAGPAPRRDPRRRPRRRHPAGRSGARGHAASSMRCSGSSSSPCSRRCATVETAESRWRPRLVAVGAGRAEAERRLGPGPSVAIELALEASAVRGRAVLHIPELALRAVGTAGHRGAGGAGTGTGTWPGAALLLAARPLRCPLAP